MALSTTDSVSCWAQSLSGLSNCFHYSQRRQKAIPGLSHLNINTVGTVGWVHGLHWAPVSVCHGSSTSYTVQSLQLPSLFKATSYAPIPASWSIRRPVYLQQLDSRVNILFVSLYSECFSASSVRTDLTDALFCFELSEFQETNSFVDSLWEAIMKTTRKKARTARFLQRIFDSLNLNLSTLHLFFLSLDWLTSTCSTVGIANQCLLTYFH